MNYEEITRETAELTKRIMLKNDIISAILITMCAALIILAARMIWEEYRDRKERKLQEVIGGYEYQPTVTDTIQYVNGVEFHRMGPATRR